jgi:hypothetical protein
VNEDILSNVRQEASSHFRNKKRKYLKEKTKELKTEYEHQKTLKGHK